MNVVQEPPHFNSGVGTGEGVLVLKGSLKGKGAVVANRRMLSKTISISTKISKLTEFEQLLFTWIIPHTDDFGRIDGDPEVIKALVIPMSKRKSKDICAALAHMAEIGLIRWYQIDGRAVIEILAFEEHQTNLGKRTESKYQGFKADSENFLDFLGSSEKFLLNLTKPNLTKLKRTKPNLGAVPAPEVVEVFESWKAELNHPQAQLDETRKSAITARLAEGYPVDRIKQAIRGIKKSPHHMGQNDRSTVYDDIELICRTGANVDKFADLDGDGKSGEKLSWSAKKRLEMDKGKVASGGN